MNRKSSGFASIFLILGAIALVALGAAAYAYFKPSTQTGGASIQTQLSDTLGTLRTNVNTNFSNIDSEIAAVTSTQATYGTMATVNSPVPVVNGGTGTTTVYSQAEIDELTKNTAHPTILRKLIACESQNTNVAMMDSNGLMSYGLLQFNGTATWQEFSPLANVSGSPMNPKDAIKVADYMISVGQLHRWTCARLTGLLS